jgi:hypothetical protein
MRDFWLERLSTMENIENRKTAKLLASDEGPDAARTVLAAGAAGLGHRCTWRAWLLERGNRGRCTVPNIRTLATESQRPYLT